MWFTSKDDPLDVVEQHFKKHELKYDRLDSDTILTGFGVGERNCMISIRHERGPKTLLFIFHPLMSDAHMLQAVAGGNAPYYRVHESAGHTTGQIQRVCEMLLKFNYDLLLGSFERDDSDGEVRFCVALPYGDNRVSESQIESCFRHGLPAMAKAVHDIEAIVGTQAQMSI